MKKWSFKRGNAMDKLLLLRSGSIIIQLATVLGIFFVMDLAIAVMPILLVICAETVFHLLSVLVYRKRHVRQLDLVLQLLADVVFLTLLLSLSGGATNAFVSLLLLPIVIAAVSLPTRWLALVSVAAMAAYSVMLLKMPTHSMHHMDMNNHFIGMWVNFILSALVVTFVVGALARMISEREQAIAKQREEQLRQEQLLALGLASTQVTHQLATPLATLQLLYDELCDNQPANPVVAEMSEPLQECSSQLRSFTEFATSIREKTPQEFCVHSLVEQLKDLFQLQFPLQQLIVNPIELPQMYIQGDGLLLPALFNLLQNAVQANERARQHNVELTLTFDDSQRVQFLIRDYGKGISPQQHYALGEQLQPSEHGLGMALLLSNATIERFKGHLSLSNHTEQGAIACVDLPLLSAPHVGSIAPTDKT